MDKARVRVKEPRPLQKPCVSSRFRMTRSGQGRQRLKTFLLLDKARKEPLLPSAKIQSRWRSHQIFGATTLGPPFGAVCHAREGLDFPSLVPSVLARLLLEWYLLDCCQSRYGDLASPLLSLFHHWCHPDLPSCCQSKVVDQVPLLLLLFHHWCHPDLPSRCWSKVEGSIVPVYSPCFFFYSQLMIQVCLSPFMYIVLSLYLIIDDFIAFYVSFLFCNNYFVNECAGVLSFDPYLEQMPLSVRSYYFEFIETLRAQQCRL